MKISYFVPVFHNIGDKIVWLGTKQKYEKLYPNSEHELIFCNETITPTKLSTDIFVVCGTPWIWDLCIKSDKYGRLKSQLSLLNASRIEAIGIGANFPLAWLDRKWLMFQHTFVCKEMFEIWGKFDSIIVRDVLAKTYFDCLGVNCSLDFCPSYGTSDYLEIKSKGEKYNLFIAYDLANGIGGNTFSEEYKDKWTKSTKNILEKYNINKIICICPKEEECLKKEITNIESYAEQEPKSDSTKSVVRLLNLISESKLVVSARVHCAIPSFSMGKKTILIPVDSRYLTAIGVSCETENKI